MDIERYVKVKINEYINLLRECGFVTDTQILNEMYEKLNLLVVERIYNAPGDAVITGNILKICWENIEKNMKIKGEYYIDEVLYHEFSHFLNSFHNAIYGEDRFIVSDYIQNKMSLFTTIELLEQGDELLYNQDPCFGVILLDEFVAQSISQKMVEKKFEMLDENSKRRYVFDENLREYKDRIFITDICEPPMRIKTSLADYPEFDVFAKKFIKKYGYDKEEFINNSLQEDFLRNFINLFTGDTVDELYIDLCYLGLIQQRVYLLKGFSTIEDKNDPAYDPKKVNFVMRKILKK